ncbi:MAG: FAD binding domain-containing protein [Phycisphaerales bacterium JB039]
MNPFSLTRPNSLEAAAATFAEDRFALPVLKGGGMDLLDLLKEGLIEPDALVDVKRLGRDGPPIGREGGRIRIAGAATLAEIAADPLLGDQAPVIAQAVYDAASPQVRTVATAAGNLLQRPRCWYFRNRKFHCNKKGGSQCFAMDGENRYHAIFHRGPCVIVHPSNLAPALHVLDGQAHLVGGQRDSIAIADLFHMPDRGILDEHNLATGEVITHLTVRPGAASGFYAIKERQSFDWPLAIAAVALELDGPVIRAARVCAGAVAPVPWPLPQVEQALAGVSVEDDETLRAACAISIEGAEPLSQNAYKLKLLPVAVRRAVLRAAGRGEEPTS